MADVDLGQGKNETNRVGTVAEESFDGTDRDMTLQYLASISAV